MKALGLAVRSPTVFQKVDVLEISGKGSFLNPKALGKLPPTPMHREAEPRVTPPDLLSPEAGELLHQHGPSLVVVKGDGGSGSGFICRNGKATSLYTNIHVIAEISRPQFTRMDGVATGIGGVALAAGRHVARLEVKSPPNNPLEVIANFEDNVRIGDAVIVLGNSGGGGVVTGIKGNVAGIGPDRIEVTAEFIPGNSGSPIIHVKSGKVIGVATYLTRREEDPTKASSVVVRRFG